MFIGNWNRGVMSTHGKLFFDGNTCRYEGDIITINLNIHGNDTFHSMNPLGEFQGKFEKDIPVSGSLWENEELGYQPMKKISPVSCITQKPYELDEETRTKYEEDLATQRTEETQSIQKEKPAKPQPSKNPDIEEVKFTDIIMNQIRLT